jgi:hypothetical protein
MSEKENPQTEDVIQVTIQFDMKTNGLKMKAECPTTVLLGILETAKMMVFRAQVVEFLKLDELRKQASIEIVPAGVLPTEGKA